MGSHRIAYVRSRTWLSTLATAYISLVSACSGGGGGGGGGGPAAPNSLEALLVSSTEVDLVWSYGAPQADAFRVERSDGPAGQFSFLGSVAGAVQAYHDSGLLPDETYGYRVVAVKDGKHSEPSEVVLVTTSAPPPCLVPPQGLTATGLSSSKIRLVWNDASSCEEDIRVERAPQVSGQPGAFSQIAVLSPNTEQFDDVGLEPDETYWYRVRTVADGASSPWSTKVQGKTLSGSSGAAGVETIALVKTQSRPQLLLEEDGRSYVGFASEPGTTVVIAREADGSVRWQRELEGQHLLARASDGDLWILSDSLLTSSSYGLAAGKLSASNGQILWQTEYGTGGGWKIPDRSPNAAPLDTLQFVPPGNALDGLHAGQIDGNGDLLWQQGVYAYDGNTHALMDGGWLVWVAGPSHYNAVARLHPDGTLDWQYVFYQVGGLATLQILDLWEHADGTIGLFGMFDSDKPWIANLDAAGQLLEQTTLTAPELAIGSAMSAVDSQGERYIATGGYWGPWVFALAANGELRWQRKIETPANESVQFVLPRESGGCILVGTTDYGVPVDQSNTWVVALDGEGNLDWERCLDVGATEWILSAAACDGGIVLAGNAASGPSSYAAWVAKLGNGGALASQAVWSKPTEATYAVQMEPLAGGGWVLAGTRYGSTTFLADLCLVEISQQGLVLRSNLIHEAFVGPTFEERASIGRDQSGSLHVLSRNFTASLESDIVCSVLSGEDESSPAPQAAACSQELPYSTSAITVSGGVATAIDSATEITSSVHAGQAVSTWFIFPGVLVPAAATVSAFQGVAQILPTCKP